MPNVNIYELLYPFRTEKYKKGRGEKYSKEEVIYYKNEHDRNIYLVSSGKVKLVNYDKNGNEYIQYFAIKGELFGEFLLLEKTVHYEFAIACDSNTIVYKVSINKLNKLMINNYNLSLILHKCIAVRIRKINRRVELLTGLDVTTRVIAFLYDMYLECNSLKVNNSLTQKEIASLLATSRESVARVFNYLKSNGVIEYDRKKLTIKNPKLLKEMSGW